MSGHFSSFLDKIFPSRREAASCPCNLHECHNYGEKTGTLQVVFDSHKNVAGFLTSEKLREALSEVGIHLLPSQAFQLLHSQCLTKLDHATFGEFCIIADVILEQQQNSTRERRNNETEHRKLRRRTSGFGDRCQVFLGGSCNPTTWRYDKAMPFLDQHGITYFNPQVGNWTPDLIAAEDHAKQDAEILFFVIDSQTRSITSVVEAAYLAGCGRQMVIVIQNGEDSQPPTPTELKTQRATSIGDFEDIDHSRSVLQYLADKMGTPVFTNMDEALECVKKLAEWNKEFKMSSYYSRKATFTDLSVVESNIRALKQAFDDCDRNHSGRLEFKCMSSAFKRLTKEILHPDYFSQFKNLDLKKFTFDEFCCIFTEFKHKKRKNSPGAIARFFGRFLKPSCNGPPPSSPSSDLSPVTRPCIYVGGSCKQTQWRDAIVLPTLQRNGVTYINYNSIDPREKEKCRLLLYVIEQNTMGTVEMMEIGYDIGQGYNMVLCIQELPQDINIDGNMLSPRAVKDYNRCRMYLSDTAKREGVPVFTDVEEATIHAIERIMTMESNTGL